MRTQVRFAKSHNYIQAGSGPSNNRQLFYSNAPSQLHEEEISTFFSQVRLAVARSGGQLVWGVGCSKPQLLSGHPPPRTLARARSSAAWRR